MCGCDSKMCCSWESWDINMWIRVECVEGKKYQVGNDIATHGAILFVI